jgi:L-cysteine:1D-myo-inositol 2-amino-2-deoxy-alpha-D-glucopyranoside ligase
MIGLDGEKMSKSLGNLVFVSRLIQSGINPASIRWALMDHQYGAELMWSDALMQSAEAEIARLQLNLAKVDVAPTDSVIHAIISSLADNLNTPAALLHLRNWMDATESGATGGEAGELSRALDTLLGISL